jgi:hypothetical protein
MQRATLARILAVLAAWAPGRASADAVSGPALVAWFPHYNQELQPGIGTLGAGCLNEPEQMPVDRIGLCERPTVEELSPGRYRVSLTNGAPFPRLADDSGHAVFVAAVGSNARCFEEETSDDGHDLVSVVRCVVPDSGQGASSNFAWTYRADSTNFPQYARYQENFAYASVDRSGTLDLEGSFNPMNLRAADIAVEQRGVGDFSVVFTDLNPGDSMLDPAHAPYSVSVQKSCRGDLEGGAEPGGCFRAVCAVRSWTPGSFEHRDTTVDVTCTTEDGSPRDTAFRVFFGESAFTSQGSWEGGMRYGWLSYDFPSDAGACHEGSELSATSQHETPISHYPGLPVRACRDEVGLYRVDFLDGTVAPYAIDAANFALSTLGGEPRYCNVMSAECASTSTCGVPDGPDRTRITVGCFDTQGESADAPWSLNFTY